MGVHVHVHVRRLVCIGMHVRVQGSGWFAVTIMTERRRLELVSRSATALSPSLAMLDGIA